MTAIPVKFEGGPLDGTYLHVHQHEDGLTPCPIIEVSSLKSPLSWTLDPDRHVETETIQYHRHVSFDLEEPRWVYTLEEQEP